MNRAAASKPPAAEAHRLIAALAPEGRARLMAASRPFAARRGVRLIEASAAMESVFFLQEGLVAPLARAADGGTAEAGLLGPGGLVGSAAALGAEIAATDAIALTAASGVTVGAEALREAAAADPAFRRAVVDHALERIAETERLCACAALHSVEQRLARWLCQASALLGARPIEITHQQLAALFGVRRASVTVSLHLLEGEMAVRCRRGRIEIRSAARLERLSCGCGRPAGPLQTA